MSRLSSRDLFRRDWKEVSVPLPASADGASAAQQQQVVQIGFASVPQGLSTWLDRIETSLGTNPEDVKQPAGRIAAWESFWVSLESWMREKSLDICVVGTSFREARSAEERGASSASSSEERAGAERSAKDKHRRET